MTDTDLAFSSVEQLGSMLRAKTVSSVELTKVYLKRLHTIGKSLNAVVTIFDDLALAEAAKADALLSRVGDEAGPLTGIPYGVKDLLAATGGPTTWGAAPYKHQVFDYDATVVTRLRAAGAVLVAKLAMIELAGGMGYDQANASFTGPCHNPWNRAYWTGGSSSGPGAATASGCVAFAIGSETDGSITNPSAYCGLSGIRPTYGRVSRHGAMALCWTLDKLGPMCRTASDAHLVLAAIAGADPDDPTSSSLSYDGWPLFQPKPLSPAEMRVMVHAPIEVVQSLRVGVIRHATDKVQPEVRKNFEAALDVLTTAGAITEPVEFDLPKYPYDDCIGAIIAGEGGAAFRDIIQDGRVQQLADPGGRRGGYSNFVVPAVDYVDAMRTRAPMKMAFAKLFEEFDVIAAPTFATVALPIDISFDKAYPGTNDTALISACNLIGIPAISVPSGFGIHGLPTGIMFVAPAFEERKLAELGARYQGQTHWHTHRPPQTA